MIETFFTLKYTLQKNKSFSDFHMEMENSLRPLSEDSEWEIKAQLTWEELQARLNS